MKYTFIIVVNDENSLEEKINSLNVFENKEIILLGDANDESRITETYKNVKYISCDLSDIGKCYNIALEQSNGDYINFSLATDYISKDTYRDIKEICTENSNEIIALRSKNIDKISSKKPKLIKTELIDISENNRNILYISCYLFPQNIYKSINFLEGDPYNYGINYIIDAVIKNTYFILIKNRYCYYLDSPAYLPDSPVAAETAWYTDDIKEYIIPLLNRYTNYYVKNIVLKLIYAKIKANTNSVIMHPFNDDELKQLLNALKKALKKIDDELILSNSYLKKEQKRILLFIKYGIDINDKIELSPEGDIVINDLVIDEANNYPIRINAINKIKNKIVFDAEYNGKVFIQSDGKINGYFNDQKLNLIENNVYSYTRIWDKVFNTKYTFSFEIPEEIIVNNSIIKFFYKYKSNAYELNISFNPLMPQAHLTKLFSHSYWKYNKNAIITFKRNTIVFKKVNLLKLIKQELGLYYEFLFKSQKKSLGIRAFILRVIYRLTRPYYKNKRIWVTFDKLYKGGDNGEYFYQYMLKQKSNIRCYYIINKDAYDYKRLKKQKYILKFKSLKEYLIVLNAECIFATHAKVFNMCSLTKGKEKYFRDLLNQEIFCLQHGLTIQNIAHIQNRIYDNTKLYFCASPKEITNIKQDMYDYDRFNYIKETGLARYDGLKNNDQRVILITPTWRANMANKKTTAGKTRPYYKEFKNTIYFKIYNDLINNKELINAAKKYNYKITYLIHPTLSAQINDFDTNDYVNIYSVTEDQSYEKLLTTSSLMVTDYSGVQFDFAYMRKPILYYHPKELPPHYDNGGINYETDGFGPIYTKQEDLVDSLANYMANECKTESKYIKRADKFFLFNDYKNCERIYKEAEKYMEWLHEKA